MTRQDSNSQTTSEVSLPEFLFECVEECGKTLGYVAGAMGLQPNFALFDFVQDSTQRRHLMAAYLREYQEGLLLAGRKELSL